MLNKIKETYIPKIKGRILPVLAIGAMTFGATSLTSCSKDDPVEPVKTTATHTYTDPDSFYDLKDQVKADIKSGKHNFIVLTAIDTNEEKQWTPYNIDAMRPLHNEVLDYSTAETKIILDGIMKNVRKEKISQATLDWYKEYTKINITFYEEKQNQK